MKTFLPRSCPTPRRGNSTAGWPRRSGQTALAGSPLSLFPSAHTTFIQPLVYTAVSASLNLSLDSDGFPCVLEHSLGRIPEMNGPCFFPVNLCCYGVSAATLTKGKERKQLCPSLQGQRAWGFSADDQWPYSETPLSTWAQT